jgi:protein-tyrosine phosphatase
MDHVNLRAAQRACSPDVTGKLELFLRFAGLDDIDEVPDPYYGSSADFQRVIELAEAGSRGLIARLR